MRDALQRALDPFSRKIASLVVLGLVKLVYKSDKQQQLQAAMLDGELRDKLKHYQNYGFTHHPHNDAECLTLFANGDKAEGLVVAVNDRRYHMQVEQGEVALYDDQKQVVYLTRDGIRIETARRIDLKASDMTVDVPLVKFTGDIDVSGIRFLPHTHGGVERGGAETDPPSA